MHLFLKGNLRETCTCAFPLQVLQDLPVHLQGLHVPYYTLTCTLHPYQVAVGPVSIHSLLFDVQVVTLLLGKYTLFACANLCYPTTRLYSYFSTIFAAHLHVYTRTMGCKRGFCRFKLSDVLTFLARQHVILFTQPPMLLLISTMYNVFSHYIQ